MDKLRTIRTFVLVVQNKSFADAAEQLNISPSLVSKQVAGLEKSLGVRLLSRTTRRVDITEIGQQYYESCVKVLRDMEVAEDFARDMQRTASGTITVHASHSIAVLYLGQLLSDFSAKYPNVEVTLVIDEHPSHSILAAQRGLDVALHLGPFHSEDLVARTLAEIEWHVYASPEYLKRHEVPASPGDLADHNCLVHSSMAPDRVWHFDGPRGRESIQVKGSLFSNSSLTLRDTALNGVGVAMLPSFCISPYGSPSRLVKVLDAYGTPKRNLYLLVSPDRRRPRRIRIFMDFTTAWFNERRWGP